MGYLRGDHSHHHPLPRVYGDFATDTRNASLAVGAQRKSQAAIGSEHIRRMAEQAIGQTLLSWSWNSYFSEVDSTDIAHYPISYSVTLPPTKSTVHPSPQSPPILEPKRPPADS